MTDIIKKDESILSDSEKKSLDYTLTKLEAFYPEHKTYAMDALCSQQRENCVKFQKKLGYESIEAFLLAYGFEIIKGAEVYELRKDCGITPGNEPDLIKARFDNTMAKLNEYYPDHVIERAIQRDHSNLASTLAGFWQWLGYKSTEDMLTAYGFTYKAKAGRTKSVDPEAIIAELKKRYPDGVEMTATELKEANPDLKIKSIMNSSKELFGMSFGDYLLEQGILRKHVKTTEEIAATQKNQQQLKDQHEKDRAVADLADYESYYQQEYLGWGVLPETAEQLFKENSTGKSKRRIDNIINRFGIDADLHFGNLGVLASNNTDNDLRLLIQNISFSDIANKAGLNIPKAETCSNDIENARNERISKLSDDLKQSGNIHNTPATDASNQKNVMAKVVSADDPLTQIQQECIDAIKTLSVALPVVKSADIVRTTGRSKSSISININALKDMGFVDVGENGWITLRGEDTSSEKDSSIKGKSAEEIQAWINSLDVKGAQLEYLMTIADLSEKLPVVRAIDICTALGKSRSTVSTALKTMKEEGYIIVDNDMGWISLNQK